MTLPTSDNTPASKSKGSSTNLTRSPALHASAKASSTNFRDCSSSRSTPNPGRRCSRTMPCSSGWYPHTSLNARTTASASRGPSPPSRERAFVANRSRILRTVLPSIPASISASRVATRSNSRSHPCAGPSCRSCDPPSTSSRSTPLAAKYPTSNGLDGSQDGTAPLLPDDARYVSICSSVNSFRESTVVPAGSPSAFSRSFG